MLDYDCVAQVNAAEHRIVVVVMHTVHLFVAGWLANINSHSVSHIVHVTAVHRAGGGQANQFLVVQHCRQLGQKYIRTNMI